MTIKFKILELDGTCSDTCLEFLDLALADCGVFEEVEMRPAYSDPDYYIFDVDTDMIWADRIKQNLADADFKAVEIEE